ncbi:MAG: hypothetical protein M3R26_02930 [Actinomycetota bacterium]|nr:hypothetical protein [Actinomycetota bacterium]
MSLALAWVVGALVASLGLLVARAVAPGRHELELDVYVLVLGGMALLALISSLREVAPVQRASEFEQALDQHPPDPPRIAELDRLEREVYMGSARSFDLHYRLRPVIREIAAGRLERRGLRLDSASEAVRAMLGENLWELARPDREPPVDRQAAGPGVADVRRTVEELERL